jgi:hypothetical protein
MERLLKRLVAGAALTLGFAVGANANTYYLDNYISGASDSNACTAPNAPCASFAHAVSLLNAGDTLYIGSHHGTSTVDTSSLSTLAIGAGTAASPAYIYAVNDSNSTYPWSGGTYVFSTSDLVDPSQSIFPIWSVSSSLVTINGSFFLHGLELKMTNSGTEDLELGFGGSSVQVYENDAFVLSAGSSSSYIEVTTASTARAIYYNPGFYFTNASQYLNVAGGTGNSNGCSRFFGSGFAGTANFLMSGSTTPTTLTTINGGCLIIEGGDYSGPTTLSNGTGTSGGAVLVRDAKLSISSGNYFTGTATSGLSVRAENTNASAIGYDLHWRGYFGSVDTDTANYRSGGFNYNGMPLSYKITTTTNANFALPASSVPIDIGHLTAGASTTITFNVMFDGASTAWNKAQLTDHDMWLMIGADTVAGSPNRGWNSDKSAAYPATANNQGNSGTTSGSWTTSGVTTPEVYTVSLTFTPQVSGHYTAFLNVNGSANARTVWLDPQYTCSGNCS